ncbi:MAG: hypothetical protein A2Y58_06170 [Chloroflexi bacterium RBG_13_51_52]|nr:MAG: hypothetical protein A2Y58_06170 [Chloroflexi bacterium RBG_13_51_52]
MPEIKKQLPLITASDKAFWDAAKKHELVMYKCLNCGNLYSQANDCVACGNPQMEWVKVSGKGEVFTYCIYHQPFHPAWKDDIPYNVAYVKLAEGPLLMTNIVDCDNKDIYIGMSVEVVFEDVTEEVTLPKFKPVKNT